MADVQEQGRARSKLAILFEQARAAEDKGDLRTALDRYKMILQIDQKFFEAWLNAGAIYTRQGKSDKAITCYQRALASKNDVRAHYNLAVEYYKKEDYAAAEKSLRSVLKLEPRNLKAYLLLGYVFGKTGRNDKAEIAIRNALKIEPDNKAAQTALALLYFHTGRTELALRQIKLLRAKNPKDPFLATLEAKLALAGDDLATAATNFKEVAAQDPQLAEFYKTLRQKLPQETQKGIRGRRNRAEQKQNKTTKDLLDLSLLQFFDGEPQKAMETLERLCATLES